MDSDWIEGTGEEPEEVWDSVSIFIGGEKVWIYWSTLIEQRNKMEMPAGLATMIQLVEGRKNEAGKNKNGKIWMIT